MNQEIIAEDGYPPPKVNGVRNKYPWKTMEVGQSFFIPTPKDYSSVQSQASVAGRNNGRKFICRRVDGGARVWRIA